MRPDWSSISLLDIANGVSLLKFTGAIHNASMAPLHTSSHLNRTWLRGSTAWSRTIRFRPMLDHFQIINHFMCLSSDPPPHSCQHTNIKSKDKFSPATICHTDHTQKHSHITHNWASIEHDSRWRSSLHRFARRWRVHDWRTATQQADKPNEDVRRPQRIADQRTTPHY